MNCPAAQGRRRRGARTPQLARRPERERHERERAERYANAKWGSAPAAEALPPPPTHWRRADGRCRPEMDRALPLKLLLNVAVSA